MKNICLLLIVFLGLSACNPARLITHPRPWGLADTPEGSAEYQQGWEDGCDTGLSSYGGYHYRRKAYEFRQDLSLIDNPEYYRAWKDGYSYCRLYNLGWNRPWQE